MSKFIAALRTAALTASFLVAAPSHAAVETFDSQQSAAANGFNLGNLIIFHDAGRPYLEAFAADHRIDRDTPFIFNSLDFNFDPWVDFDGAAGNTNGLNMKLLDAGNNILLDALITIPTDHSWITYFNTIANVSTIYFSPTGDGQIQGFWPSFDNLDYTEPPPSTDIPEPATLALFSLGLLGFAAARHRK